MEFYVSKNNVKGKNVVGYGFYKKSPTIGESFRKHVNNSTNNETSLEHI